MGTIWWLFVSLIFVFIVVVGLIVKFVFRCFKSLHVNSVHGYNNINQNKDWNCLLCYTQNNKDQKTCKNCGMHCMYIV